MGQFRSTWQARRIFPVDLASFGVGFFLSASASFALAAVLGGALSSLVSVKIRLALLLGAVLLFLAIDLVRSRGGLHCSLGLRRQTPRRLGFHPLGPSSGAWTPASRCPPTAPRRFLLLGLACVALGFGHPAIGLAYAAGFVGSLVVSCAWPRKEASRRDLQIVDTLRGFTRHARVASFMVLFLLRFS